MRINIDFETYSAADLKQVGMYRYVDDVSTGIICLSYSIDNGPCKTWFPELQQCPEEVRSALRNSDCEIHAFNAEFEREVIRLKLGLDLPASRFRCTQAACRYRALIPNLNKACTFLGLSGKDEEGKKVMLKWSKTARKASDIPSDELATIAAYCEKDVQQEQQLGIKVGTLSEHEQRVWEITVEMNTRGIAVDLDLVNAIQDSIEAELPKYLDRFRELTGLNPTQNVKYKAWLVERGVECTGVGGDVLVELLAGELPDEVRETLKLKQLTSKTSIAKMRKIKNLVCSDGVIRGSMQYHSATTGRWSSVGVQLQNLPRGSHDPDRLVDCFLSGDIEQVREIAGNVFEAAVSCVRACLIAGKGKKLVIADYSGIEARKLAYLAKQKDLVQAFHKNLDIYCDFGRKIYGRTITKADKTERAVSKVAVLGLGYQMGWRKFRDQAKKQYGLDISAELAQRIVATYRTAYSDVKEYWWRLEREAQDTVTSGVAHGRFFMGRNERTLHYKLNSGRVLTYWHPTVYEGEYGPNIRYYRPDKGQMRVANTYGGKLTENICQAESRDILASALVACADNDYIDLLITVHDEIVGQAPEDLSSEALDKLEADMVKPLEWCPDMPLDVEGFTSFRFRK